MLEVQFYLATLGTNGSFERQMVLERQHGKHSMNNPPGVTIFDGEIAIEMYWVPISRKYRPVLKVFMIKVSTHITNTF
jgi:hypothetical protein